MHGRIFDIKQFAIHDGGGIRTTVFLKGCPLDCWWCHNPESRSEGDNLVYYPSKCKNSGECIDVSESFERSADGESLLIDRENVDNVAEAAAACPTGALEVVGRDATVDEVMEEIRKSVIFFDSSDGGVTISGGEPLQQPKFTNEILAESKKIGIDTTLDTTGYTSSTVIESVIPHTDSFLYDLKFVNEELHEKYTGVSNEPILNNLKKLAALGRGDDVVIRRPVVTDINDGDKHTRALIDFLSKVDGVHRIDLLPFHDVSEKYDRFGMNYRINNRNPPSDQVMNAIKAELIANGFDVNVSGQ